MTESAENLKKSLDQYNDQLAMIQEALCAAGNDTEKESLISLQSDINQLVHLTQQSLDALDSKANCSGPETSQKSQDTENNVEKTELDDEYALFMAEMAKTGAYDQENDKEQHEEPKDANDEDASDNSDIEDELSTLLGMKCAVYHTHKWGGQPSLHNAMVSAVVPRQDDDQFTDLQVRVLFTHPTHTEMLPCPFFLDGECRFTDEKCRYSHGAVVHLSSLKEALEPNFESIKIGSRVLLKLKPPDNEDISLTKKSTEKYHLWHRAVVKSIDAENNACHVKLEHGVAPGEKRKSGSDEVFVNLENLFPLNTEDNDSESDDSVSDTEYPESKANRLEAENDPKALLIEQSLQSSGPAIGEWERHTRGIGSKLMLAMGYVAGTGLGAAGAGRVAPVQARVLPAGRSLDHCMAISERAAAHPMQVEQKLKRMQEKEEERHKRAYEREKERERRNVFNFLNRTLGDKDDDATASPADPANVIKQSTSKDLNIEQFKITEETRRLEREITKLNNSLFRHEAGTSGHNNVNVAIAEKTKELNNLKSKEQHISKEQRQRKDKQKMTVF